ncbi:MAG TPA: glutathione S-transferase N-terminal domain-containing protein [Polyangiaceae bacterium]|nr:glutathione S-transferase N-terminal domain-containing protein [Polyangiaceae bacterium]
MKIYGHPMSTCTRKVLATLHEKKASFEIVPVDLTTGAHKRPEHLARQPFGQIPVIDDGDFRLYESRAIIRYLDQVLPGATLTPSDPKGRGLMEQWISVETSNFTPHAMTIIYQLFFGPMRGAQPDPAKVEEGRTKLAKSVEVLDRQLAGGPYLLGERFSLADICYMPYFEYLTQTAAKDALLDHANVAAWWKRTSERESWKKVTSTKV